MSIRNYLTQAQLDWFVSSIRNTCEREHQEEQYYINLVGREIYRKLTRCRGSHDLTGKIHMTLLAMGKRVEGIESVTVESGLYTQSEQRSERAIIQVYHSTNPLNSALVRETKERARRENKHFYCLKYNSTPDKRLHKIVAVGFTEGLQVEREVIYSMPLFNTLTGKKVQ